MLMKPWMKMQLLNFRNAQIRLTGGKYEGIISDGYYYQS